MVMVVMLVMVVMIVMMVIMVMVVMVSPDFRMLWMSGVVYWAVRGGNEGVNGTEGKKGGYGARDGGCLQQ